MEPSQKYALELALRYFYIPDDVHLTVTDRLRFDWLLQQPLASWQFLTLQEFRSREFVPPNMCERLFARYPGYARYRKHFDISSARFLWNIRGKLITTSSKIGRKIYG
ncbi:hypothetical protein DAPPUDRAFT_108947 [Daphnia pulex]|uniref:Uncharacterized protein n=1 Tax=Daphnia pulex TaxID=6669 RepID=E9H1B0_DAPPU|nr:hypothetical protein DAPPUDRAFT_108947 [Daphnia pulex]|eukprot:EFX74414.1 hypothetical protein DAPPUDRAFT_108947 [Daphnia pulex]